MRLYAVAVFLSYVCLGESYTKYGRSCKDIGCPSNQQCVMETDPCSYYQRQGECGSYPTCKRTTNTVRTCTNYVCPPTKVCKMDGDTPKCIDDQSKVGVASYDTQNTQNTNHNVQQSGSGAQSSGNLYPNLPHGETTPRPNAYRPQAVGAGYQGGSVGSGYPGYPQQPGQGGYQQPGHGGQGGYQQPGNYPNGYPQQGRYPQGGYQQGGYQGQGQGAYQPYPGYQGGAYQGGYQGGYQQQGYGQKSTGTSFTDQISSSLKSIGSDILKNALAKAITGRN